MRQFKPAVAVILALLTITLVSPAHPYTSARAAGKAPDSDFTSMSATLPGINSGQSVWGDYNNDGHLDVALSGISAAHTLTTTIYGGDGMGSFSQTAAFTPTDASALAWGDYNNDGNLDLLHTGDDANDIYNANVFTGDGQGHFLDDFAANLTGMLGGGVDWGDYNHDGSPDILLSGSFLTGNSTVNAYAGDRLGQFTHDNQLQVGTGYGKVAWGDFNNDGNLDFVLATDLDFRVQVYQGNGHGGFTLDPVSLPQVHLSCAAWGDYNADGNLDLVVSGRTADSQHITSVYAGDGHGGFTLDPAANLPGTEQGSVDWGDFNNDGKLDLLISGFSDVGGQPVAINKVYAGDGVGGFTEDTAANLLGIAESDSSWGDFNNDGKLDILASGSATGGITTTVYRNDASIPANQPPSAPTGLSAVALTTDTVQLAWQPATDDHTPAATLSYNVRVGSTPGASDIVGPMADINSGQRRLPGLGNVQLNRHYTLSGLNPSATYYWSVQAIDNGWRGGQFAAEGSFTLTTLATPTPSATAAPSTATATSIPPTNTPTGLPATSTPTGLPATATPAPATDTPIITATNTATLPTATPTDCPNLFVDITGNVFYNAIHALNCLHVNDGIDRTHYQPAGTSTRGQFAKVVVLGFGIPLSTPATPSFTDVPPTYFAYIYIESGLASSILSGFDAASCATHGATFPCYLPNLAITRGQLTKLVVSAGHYALYTPTTPDFIDVPPSNVFYASIETAFHSSIISGYPDRTFRPNNNIRRDEMAQIVFEGIVHMP